MLRRLALAAALLATTTAFAGERPDRADDVQAEIEQRVQDWLRNDAPEALRQRLAEATPEERQRFLDRLRSQARERAETKLRARQATNQQG